MLRNPEDAERDIKSLLPEIQPIFRAFLADLVKLADDEGYEVGIGSAYRTYEEQNRLYAKGRTTQGPKVTNAKGGYSNHNFRLAIDIDLFKDGKYVVRNGPYGMIEAPAARAGLEWGGNWKSIEDRPHVEFPTGLTTAQKRDRVAKGLSLLPAKITPPVQTPKVWTVEHDGATIWEDCKDTGAVRAAVEALGGTITVRSADKVIVIHDAR